MLSGLAQITFSQPALLLGLAVVVLPVLIHLLCGRGRGLTVSGAGPAAARAGDRAAS